MESLPALVQLIVGMKTRAQEVHIMENIVDSQDNVLASTSALTVNTSSDHAHSTQLPRHDRPAFPTVLPELGRDIPVILSSAVLKFSNANSVTGILSIQCHGTFCKFP